MKMQRRIFVLLIAFAVVQSYFYYSQLPDMIASNFDGAGEANGWSSKNSFFALYGGLAALFAATFILLPRSLARIPVAFISMPNKEYWLAPERQAETLECIIYQMLIMGNAVLIFLICIIQLVLAANVDGTSRISSGTMWILLGGYLAFTAVWTIKFLTRFSKTGESPQP